MKEKEIWSVVVEALTQLHERMPERICFEFLSCTLKDTDEIVRLTATEILQAFMEQQQGVPSSQTTTPQPEEPGSQGRVLAQGKGNQRARNTVLIQLLVQFLQGKQGYVYDTLLGSTRKQVLVLYCTYKSEGDSMQEAILTPLEQSTPIRCLGAARREQDEVLRCVAGEMIEKLEKGRWQEVLLISMELPAVEGKEVGNAMPAQLVFCGLGYRDVNDVELKETPAFAYAADHPEDLKNKRENTYPLSRQLVAAYKERWKKALAERAHEMTGLKLFYEAAEERSEEDYHPWMVSRSGSPPSCHPYS